MLTAALTRLPSSLPVTAGFLGLGLLYGLWRALGTGEASAVGQSVNSLAFIPFNAAAAWLLLRASAQSLLSLRLRSALRFMALAMLFPMLGNLSWFYVSAVLHQDPASSWVNLLYYAYYPLALLGLWGFPVEGRERFDWWKLLLDMGTVLVGVGALAWFFAVRPTVDLPGDAIATALQLVYPVADIVILVAITTILLRGLPTANRAALTWLLVGFGAGVITDFFYAFLFAASGWTGAVWTDGLYVLSYLIIGGGAEWLARRPALAPGPGGGMLDQIQPYSPLPLIASATVASLLVWAALRSWTPILSPLALAGVLVTLLIGVRQALAVRQNVRLLTEHKTRESEARFEALVRHSSDVILIVNATNTVRFAAGSIKPLLGRPGEALVGLPLNSLVHAQDWVRGEATLNDLLEHPGRGGTLHWRVRHADGSWRDVEAVVTNLLAEPSVGGLVLNLRDVTERDRLEDQLRQSQKMEAIGQLAGGVAHDFNNLLTSVLASSELALDELPPDSPAREDLQEISHAATRAAALTQQLLAFSRRQVVEQRVLAPGLIVTETIRMLERILGAQVQLKTSIPADLALVRGDRSQLEQILLNLAVNARDAMPGGGPLEIQLANVKLTEPLTTRFLEVPPGPYVRLTVRDSGTGMDEVTLERIFEPFFTTKQQGKGTGLGLASVYGIVRQNDWGVTVDSVRGEGTTFQVYLPVTLAEMTSEPTAIQLVPRGTGTVLLVEDEPGLRRVGQRILQAAGYTVLAAANAEEAGRVVQGHAGTIDLLLTDVIMPGDSGPVLAARLLRQRPSLRVLYMSGYAGDELGDHGMLDPGVALLQKPFTGRELTARVQQALQPQTPLDFPA